MCQEVFKYLINVSTILLLVPLYSFNITFMMYQMYHQWFHLMFFKSIHYYFLSEGKKGVFNKESRKQRLENWKEGALEIICAWLNYFKPFREPKHKKIVTPLPDVLCRTTELQTNIRNKVQIFTSWLPWHFSEITHSWKQTLSPSLFLFPVFPPSLFLPLPPSSLFHLPLVLLCYFSEHMCRTFAGKIYQGNKENLTKPNKRQKLRWHLESSRQTGFWEVFVVINNNMVRRRQRRLSHCTDNEYSRLISRGRALVWGQGRGSHTASRTLLLRNDRQVHESLLPPPCHPTLWFRTFSSSTSLSTDNSLPESRIRSHTPIGFLCQVYKS